MPKAEKGSVKDIANRMKARGLQKLKFYCQMCQKQCRDANGFKCHIQSESHLRQMKVFGDNASGYFKQYSDEFEKAFLTTLRMRHGTKKVNANNVYQEVISDKQHIHMNATHWTTLTDFILYLGKSKKCLVEENHSDGTGGWTISYIERDAGILSRREAQQRREASDRKAEEALLKRMKAQRVEAALALEKATGGTGASLRVEATSILDKDGGGEGHGAAPIKMGLASKHSRATSATKKGASRAAFGEEDDDEEDETDAPLRRKPSSVEAMMNETIRKDAGAAAAGPRPETTTRNRRHGEITETISHKRSRDDDEKRHKKKPTKHHKKDDSYHSKKEEGWLYRDILVRVISEKLEGGKYFRKKAIVDKIVGEGNYVAEVEILGGSTSGKHKSNSSGAGDVLRLDQSDLETVVPKQADTKVRILRGPLRGKKARVENLDKARYRADLVVKGEDRKVLRDVPYEDFSQVA